MGLRKFISYSLHRRQEKRESRFRQDMYPEITNSDNFQDFLQQLEGAAVCSENVSESPRPNVTLGICARRGSFVYPSRTGSTCSSTSTAHSSSSVLSGFGTVQLTSTSAVATNKHFSVSGSSYYTTATGPSSSTTVRFPSFSSTVPVPSSSIAVPASSTTAVPVPSSSTAVRFPSFSSTVPVPSSSTAVPASSTTVPATSSSITVPDSSFFATDAVPVSFTVPAGAPAIAYSSYPSVDDFGTPSISDAIPIKPYVLNVFAPFKATDQRSFMGQAESEESAWWDSAVHLAYCRSLNYPVVDNDVLTPETPVLEMKPRRAGIDLTAFLDKTEDSSTILFYQFEVASSDTAVSMRQLRAKFRVFNRYEGWLPIVRHRISRLESRRIYLFRVMCVAINGSPSKYSNEIVYRR